MRRQFLRVYLGIALVLVLAALAILLIVDREVRSVVDRRIEETMMPMIRRVRARLTEAGDDDARRAHVLARLSEAAPFSVRVVPLADPELPAAMRERLAAGEPAVVHRDDGRVIYALLDDDEAIVLGPLHRFMAPAHDPSRRGYGPRHRMRGPPGPPGFPAQGTYVMLGALLGLLVVIGAAVYLLLRPYERRIYALADVARDFGEGRLHSRAAPGRDDAIGALADAFNQMADRIERFIERQRELLRAVSHEFRTPLARLFFLVDDAEGAPTTQDKDRYLQRIEGSLQELNDLVEELLGFVRLEGDASPPEREPVDLAAVLKDMPAVVSDLRAEVELEIDCDSVPVLGVPHLLRRAVLNLVTNAVRHARERVRVSGGVDAAAVHLHVDDDGPGIPAGERERIFEPFRRLDESRSTDAGGAGLGLAIVQRIMSVHGGQVTVTDSPLGGARFTLVMPAASAA